MKMTLTYHWQSIKAAIRRYKKIAESIGKVKKKLGGAAEEAVRPISYLALNGTDCGHNIIMANYFMQAVQ